ncbi:MAG: hypothetical protein ACR2NR_19575 [Solirubrobacteraceae bacterium]
MIVIALFGLAVALYCLDGLIKLGSARPDRLVHSQRVSRHVGRFLVQIADAGSTAWLPVLCGMGAMAIGLILLFGTVRSSRQRLAVLEVNSRTGMVAARPRVLGDMTRHLVEQTEGATRVKRPRVSLSRSGRRGRLKVRGARTRTSDPKTVKQAVTEAVAPVSEPFGLKPRVSVRLSEGRGRVQ